MSKIYKLVLGQTYATLKNVYVAGVGYSAESLGSSLNAKNDTGEYYFKEVTDEVELPAAAPALVSAAAETDSAETDHAGTGAPEETLEGGEPEVGAPEVGAAPEGATTEAAAALGDLESAAPEAAPEAAPATETAPVTEAAPETAPSAPRVVVVGKGAKAKAAAKPADDADALVV